MEEPKREAPAEQGLSTSAGNTLERIPYNEVKDPGYYVLNGEPFAVECIKDDEWPIGFPRELRLRKGGLYVADSIGVVLKEGGFWRWESIYLVVPEQQGPKENILSYDAGRFRFSPDEMGPATHNFLAPYLVKKLEIR